MTEARGPFRAVADHEWNDWRWHLAHRLRTPTQIGRHLRLTDDEQSALTTVAARHPIAITPYYLSLIDPREPTDPLRRQAIPTSAELVTAPSERADPLAEAQQMPVPGLIHRYPDRALLYVTHNCAVYCRHCFRRGRVGHSATAPSREVLGRAMDYVRAHSEIRDLLFSGGDPLNLSDERLVGLLSQAREIEHVEIVRIATRNPVTLPQRITAALAELLRAYQPIYINTQFNHPRECTPRAATALARLADAGCVLGNQMVLLRGVNDDPDVVRRLNHWLLAQRCRPYYIHQCDAAPGLSHFRTPTSSGLRIIEALRGWTSGLAVPHYVIDLPGGGGKVPLVPEQLIAHEGKRLTFRSYDGRVYDYEEG